jgi:hypothetical protein
MKPHYPFWVLLATLLLLVGIASASDPWATFVPGNVNGTAPYSVTFVSISYNNPTAWNWTFQNVIGNNTIVSFATTQNATLIFHYGGVYRIRLNSSNIDGYNITPDLVYVTVSGPLFIETTPTTTIPGMGSTSGWSLTGITAAIVAALTLIGVMLIGVGALLIIGMFGNGTTGRDGTATAPRGMTAGIAAIAVGALLLFVAYIIISPLFTIAGA